MFAMEWLFIAPIKRPGARRFHETTIKSEIRPGAGHANNFSRSSRYSFPSFPPLTLRRLPTNASRRRSAESRPYRPKHNACPAEFHWFPFNFTL
jgi:hypothetical protein